ncbi:MAG: hypothetical protein J6P10_02700 [Aeriscardovia sp.]|nr:hypothetical protein [Aeriscardovia sp.]MBQ1298972.1 hypothetical protein [Aeriscardovia sp.]
MSPRKTGMTLVMVEAGCTEVACVEDFSDLYQAGLALEQILGKESKFTEGFDPDRDADAQERELLELIKRVLRPDKAPLDLLEKCFALIENM